MDVLSEIAVPVAFSRASTRAAILPMSVKFFGSLS